MAKFDYGPQFLRLQALHRKTRMNIPLTIAVGDYEHVRDVTDGTVRVQGADLTVLRMSPEETFYRFINHQEFDVSELSFAKAIAFASQDDPRFVLLPVFPSRVFRHSSIYVRSSLKLERPEQLAGLRIGVPEWAQTAAVYSRGMLMHEHGVALQSAQWFQAGVNDAGRKEKAKLKLPDGVACTPVPDASLSQMLLDGRLDAVLSARAPDAFLHHPQQVTRLFADSRAAEQAYFVKTRIFPIMHVLAMRREVYERNRWLARNLLTAFEQAKNNSLARALDVTASHFALPWVADIARDAQVMLGQDFWPYGIDANRVTLEAFCTYAHEQGVAHRPVQPEELFVPEVLSAAKV